MSAKGSVTASAVLKPMRSAGSLVSISIIAPSRSATAPPRSPSVFAEVQPFWFPFTIA